MRKLIIYLLAAMIGAAMFSCKQAEEPLDTGYSPDTRAYGDKTPIAILSVKINEVHPVNAGDYYLPNGKTFADVVEFYAAYIGKRTVNWLEEPTLFLNDTLTNVLENDGYKSYVQPLQAKGIKVLLTITGGHKGIGLSSMSAMQTTQFAEIMAYAVEKYGLDGISFDDEYADDYESYRAASYSEIITKLHNLLPPEKLISIKDWGDTRSLSAEAVACIDYGYHGIYDPTFFLPSSSFGIAKSGWSPICINLGNYNDSYLLIIGSNANSAKTNGYGAMMFFNLRTRTENDPTKVFTMAAVGAGFEYPVTCSNGNREQDWTFVPNGYTITMDEVNGTN